MIRFESPSAQYDPAGSNTMPRTKIDLPYQIDYLSILDADGVLDESLEPQITDEKLIGINVYPPLADYYLKNRDLLKKSILEKYPQYVESILYKSILKMKEASQNQIIDYVLLKCTL